MKIDECFPLHYLFTYLSSNLPIFNHEKFLINLKTLSFINHPQFEYYDDLNINSINAVGKSIFINKYFCKLEDYNNIYSFLYMVKKKYKILSKKIILLLISKFLINYNFYEFDKIPQYGSESLYNLPKWARKIFKLNENLEEVKLLLLSKNYNPLDK